MAERSTLPSNDVCHMKSPFRSTFPSAKIIFIIPLCGSLPLYGRDFGKIYLLSCDVEKEQLQQCGHKTGSIREGCKHPELTSFLTSQGLLAVGELITTAAHMAQQLICLTDGQTK